MSLWERNAGKKNSPRQTLGEENRRKQFAGPVNSERGTRLVLGAPCGRDGAQRLGDMVAAGRACTPPRSPTLPLQTSSITLFPSDGKHRKRQV